MGKVNNDEMVKVAAKAKAKGFFGGNETNQMLNFQNTVKPQGAKNEMASALAKSIVNNLAQLSQVSKMKVHETNQFRGLVAGVAGAIEHEVHDKDNGYSGPTMAA